MADVKTAIETGDTEALGSLLAENPGLANELIVWGKKQEIRTHPLHYVSDMLSGGQLPRGKEIPILNALLAAGADYNHQASNGETALIGAASLDAEDVGLRLLEVGALPNLKGAFQETALHWAALVGMERLVNRLIEAGSDVNVKDARYESSPVGWALYGRYHSDQGRSANHHAVIAALVRAGAVVDPNTFDDPNVKADPRMQAALRGQEQQPA
jgi:ankyrin repeat protein